MVNEKKCGDELSILTDKSTTLAVMSSCFDRLALPLGRDMSILRLAILRVFRTLFKTLRTITSDTVGIANEYK